MRIPTIRLVVVLASLSLPSAVLAARGDGEAPDPERRAKVMEKLETIRIGKLTEALQLDSKSAEKVFPLLRPFNERRRTATSARWDAMKAIGEQLESAKPDEKVIATHLDDAMSANRDLAKIAEDEYAALKPVLDPVVLARYYRFQMDFEKRIGELIREIRTEGKDGKEAPERGQKAIGKPPR